MEMSLGAFGDGGWKKGADLLTRLISHGARGVRVRRLGGDRAGAIRFTQLLRNPVASLDEMTATAFARTQYACEGRDVLAIHDTTVTQSPSGDGSFLHAMIAVDAQSSAVLGALDAQFMDRRRRQSGSRVVADREACMFELFTHRPAHVHLLVRAMHERVLVGGGKLAKRAANGSRLGSTCRPGLGARCAAQALEDQRGLPHHVKRKGFGHQKPADPQDRAPQPSCAGLTIKMCESDSPAGEGRRGLTVPVGRSI